MGDAEVADLVERAVAASESTSSSRGASNATGWRGEAGAVAGSAAASGQREDEEDGVSAGEHRGSKRSRGPHRCGAGGRATFTTSMAPLVRGLIVDYGGVLTTDVFASFRAFCEAEGLAPETVRDRFLGDPEARALLERLETGRAARAGVRGGVREAARRRARAA